MGHLGQHIPSIGGQEVSSGTAKPALQVYNTEIIDHWCKYSLLSRGSRWERRTLDYCKYAELSLRFDKNLLKLLHHLQIIALSIVDGSHLGNSVIKFAAPSTAPLSGAMLAASPAIASVPGALLRCRSLGAGVSSSQLSVSLWTWRRQHSPASSDLTRECVC